MNVTVEELRRYLDGTDYPATKDQLVDQVRANYAPESLIITVDHLPEKTYGGIAEVEQEFTRHHMRI